MLHGSHRDAILADPAVFDAEWVPADFRARDGALETMARALEPILDGEPATGLLLSGPSGTGKTASSQYLLGKLRAHAASLETATVNCWSDHSRYRVLRRILAAIDGPAVATVDHAASALRDALEAVSAPTVVLLDEADQLDEPAVLYDLYELPRLHVVATANRKADVLLGLDERIRSRLRTFRTVAVEPYTTAELATILDQRVTHGLQPGVIEPAQVQEIARTANGNARDAIATLEGAAQRAVEDGAKRIDDGHVAAAIDGAGRNVRQETVERLNDHQYAIFEIVAAEPGSPGAIYDRYRRRMADPRSRRTVRKYVRKLEAYDLLEISGRSQSREYRLAPDAPRPDG